VVDGDGFFDLGHFVSLKNCLEIKRAARWERPGELCLGKARLGG
jgi:hypothetical protein